MSPCKCNCNIIGYYRYVKSSDKVFKNAEDSELVGDDERAYCLYMKFLNIIQAVRKLPEYKKNKVYILYRHTEFTDQ